MSSQNQNYSLVTLNDCVVPGFAGIISEQSRSSSLNLLPEEIRFFWRPSQPHKSGPIDAKARLTSGNSQ
jgi:hypothetical protein